MPEIELIRRVLIALGIGLLIGAERERRKAERPAAAGLRTFTIAALLGAISAMMPPPWMIGVAMMGISALAVAGTRPFAIRVIPAQALMIGTARAIALVA